MTPNKIKKLILNSLFEFKEPKVFMKFRDDDDAGCW